MNEKVIFDVEPIDVDAMCPQVSSALEKRTELHSRAAFPKMWELTDKLNSVEKAPHAVQENRRKRRSFFGFWDWILGLFLLIPGMLNPQEMIVPLVVGALAFGAGVVVLWRNKRVLLGILSLAQGVVLCMGALGNPEELGQLLVLGVAGMVIGIAALLTAKRQKMNPFDKTARQLLQGRSAVPEDAALQIEFTPTAMIVSQSETVVQEVLYGSFEWIIETPDLLLMIYEGKATILQKKEQTSGSLEDLRERIGQQVQWAVCNVS